MICILCKIVLEQSKQSNDNIAVFQNVIPCNVVEIYRASEEYIASFFRIESRGTTC
jgi:hypothetical protein